MSNASLYARRFADGLTVLLGILSWWALSLKGGSDFGFALLLFGGWCLVALVWACRVIKWLYARFKPEVSTGGWPHYLLCPLILLAVVGGESRGLPTRSVFALHRPALTRWAQRVLAQNPRAPVSQSTRVGLYRISEIKRLHGGVRFVVADADFMGREYFGFAYSPSGKVLPEPNGTTANRLSHNWLWWTRHESWD